jgi:hypothetical protein
MGSYPTSGGYKYRGLIHWDGVGRGAATLPCKKIKLLRSLQEILPDFEEEEEEEKNKNKNKNKNKK